MQIQEASDAVQLGASACVGARAEDGDARGAPGGGRILAVAMLVEVPFEVFQVAAGGKAPGQGGSDS